MWFYVSVNWMTNVVLCKCKLNDKSVVLCECKLDDKWGFCASVNWTTGGFI